jgi:hypothetical protein
MYLSHSSSVLRTRSIQVLDRALRVVLDHLFGLHFIGHPSCSSVPTIHCNHLRYTIDLHIIIIIIIYRNHVNEPQ